MKQTPLFTSHLNRDAVVEPHQGWMVPWRFTTPQAEADAARAGVGLADLAHMRSIRLAGEQARRWANGMFTNNLKRMTPGQGSRNAMCDDRGRVEGLLDLYMLAPDELLGVLDGVSPEWFEQRYRMFMMLDDVEFSEEPGWLLSLQGPGAAALLATLGLPQPDDRLARVEGGGAELLVLRRDRTGLGGFDLLVPRDALQVTWEAAVRAGAVPMGLEALDALRVHAGLPCWPQDGGEHTMAEELLLDRDALSFNKGCYVGQEVINRLHVKGLLNKRLTGLILDQDALPPDGATVLLDDQPVGTVTSAVRLDGRVLALGILRKSAWEPGTAVQVRAGDRTVDARISALPFSPAA